MPNVSARTLNVLAALVWYIGGLILLIKGSSLLLEAVALHPSLVWPALAVATAAVLGCLKVKYIFVKACRKNLARIAALEQPKIWQFYTPKFFLFLALMVATGATLSRLAHDIYPFLLAVGALDIALSIGLLGSSYVYWQQKAFAKADHR
jgi:hypothetical protein